MQRLSYLSRPLQRSNPRIKKLLLIMTGVLILALSAQLVVPFKPVPLTFQSTTVILIGMVYGPRLGTYAVISYILAGLFGMPIFENFTFGPAKLLGPTGGYILGFVPAAFISGYLAQLGWSRHIVSCFIAACLGTTVIFLFGLLMLSHLVGWHQAIQLGLMPFIISETIKLVAMAIIVPGLWKR